MTDHLLNEDSSDHSRQREEPTRRLVGIGHPSARGRPWEFRRRRPVPIQDQAIAVVAPEDLILSKLYWAKDSESELQQRDVRLLVDSIQDLDWPYLDRWAETLGVSAFLERSKST